MLTIKEYVKAESLEQAYELNQKKKNKIIGGMLWMRLSTGTIQKAIDLSGLGLDKIEETEEEFSIGCMVTLRELEQHKGIHRYTQGAMKESVRHIVGVQFRNLATIGGSIWGRFGFSDLLTLFMAMDAYVELYKGGVISMEEFASRKADNDILVRIIVKKVPMNLAYLSQRNVRTDFPVLACAVSRINGCCQASVGARPGRAVLIKDTDGLAAGEMDLEKAEKFAKWAASQIITGSNMRAGSAYRSHIAEVLIRRGCMQIGGEADAVMD